MILSQRIWTKVYETDREFQELKDLLKRYSVCVDEVSLFVDYLHTGIFPIELFEERCNKIAAVIDKLKEAGISDIGLNLLSTIGHLPEAGDYWYVPEYQMAVGADGSVSEGTYCINAPEFRSYIRKKYALMAEIHPDFIWVDDDIRFHAHDIAYGCFCDHCLQKFNKECETEFTRIELVDSLKSDSTGHLRKAWIHWNMRNMAGFLSEIEKAVHRISPETRLGLMTTTYGWTTYSGEGYQYLFEKLKAEKGRPGGGYWTEKIPTDYMVKSIETGRQISQYPHTLSDIQYEVESLPYHLLEKTPRMIINECTAGMMNGANGVAFDVLRQDAGRLTEYTAVFEQISQARDMWEMICADSKVPYGCCAVLSPTYLSEPDTNDKWFDMRENSMEAYHMNACYSLMDIGIPVTAYENAENPVYILEKDYMKGYSKEKIREWFTHAVFMDYEALLYLESIGLGTLCGVKSGQIFKNGIREVFSDDIVNEGFTGDTRDLRMQAICKESCCQLIAQNSEVRTVSELWSYDDVNQGIGFSLYENALGGRVAVCGYMPWVHIHSLAKKSQLTQVFDWLAGGMAVQIPGYLKVAPFVKKSPGEKRYIIMLNNLSMEPTGTFEVVVDTDIQQASLLRRDSSCKALKGDYVDGKAVFDIENMDAMDFRILII